jgi:dynamin 1-like protein
MEACYVNTGHPDFISGHKAMAIVNDRINASKPAPPAAPDPKSGKLAPGQINNNRDLDVDLKQEQGFFGSFWGGSAKAGQARKKGAATMEAVCSALLSLVAAAEDLRTAAAAAQGFGNAVRPGAHGDRGHQAPHLIVYVWPRMRSPNFLTLALADYNITKRTVIDTVPKAIMLNLVSHAKDDLQRELLAELYNPSALEELLKVRRRVLWRTPQISLCLGERPRCQQEERMRQHGQGAPCGQTSLAASG